MAVIFPSQLIKRDNPNLRLGIKSSLNSFKQLIASLYVIYKSTSSPKDVHYSDIEKNNNIITICLAKDFSEKVSELFSTEVVALLNKSPLFKSQIEALQVGIELFLQLGKISFVENGRQERTGENRYNKSLSFSDKMIIIDTYLSAFNKDIVQSLIINWLKGYDSSSKIEDGLKAILSTFIIDCCYKIKKTNGEEIIFNIENIYKALDSGNEVLFKDGEVVGPMRVLNSYIGENMLNDVVKTKSTYVVKEGQQNYLNKRLSMISTSLDLITRQLPFKDTSSREYTNRNVTDSQNETYNVFISALRTKPFLLLAGISGTGKSQKVQELAFMTCPEGELREENNTTPGNYRLIEVKPNWHDSSELLGYYSALSGKYELTDFIRFSYKAIQNPDTPFFLCLDEMNLAPVEQYFAEYLSVLETRKKIGDNIETQPLLTKDKFSNCELQKYASTDDGGVITKDGEGYNMIELYSESDREIIEYLKENGLNLPSNLFVIGTVNMDDTTHQFSRKVIDRAFTIEMNGGKMEDMFSEESRALLEYRKEPIPLDVFKSEFVRASEILDDERFKKYADTIKKEIPQLLGDSDGKANEDCINGILNKTPFRVSYRVQNELVLYLSVLIENANFPEDITPLIHEATLAILLEKVLPRVQGEQKQLETKNDSNVLKDMKMFVENHFKPIPEEGNESSTDCLYSKVLRKLEEMDKKLENYYTNFF